MSAPVGSIQFGVSVDASDLSSQITKAVQDAMAEAVSSVEAGMGRVESSLGSVDTDGFTGVSGAAEDAMSDAARAADAGMESVQRSVDSVDGSGFTDVSAAAEDAASVASDSIGGAMADVSSSIGSIDTAGLNEVSAAAETAAESVSQIGASAADADGALAGLGGTAADAAGGLSGVGSQADSSSGKMGLFGSVATSSMAKTLGAVGAAVGGVKLLTDVIGRAADTATAEAALGSLYGDAEAAADMMVRVNEIASGSAIDRSAYQDLATGLAYLGVQGEQAEGIMENLGLAIVGAGGDSSAMDTVVNALTRMSNEGKVTRQSLAQLSSAGVPILDSLAHALGVEVDEVLEMATDGMLDLTDVMGVLEDGTGEWLEKQIEGGKVVNDTFGARWSRAKDNVLNAMSDAIIPALDALGPVLTIAADAVAGLFQWFSSLSGSGAPEWFDGLTEKIGPLVDAFRELFGTMVEVVVTFWQDTLQPIFESIGDLFVRWWAMVEPILAAMYGFFIDHLVPTVLMLWDEVFQPVFERIGTIISNVWHNRIQPAVSAMMFVFENVLAPVVTWLWESIFGPMFRLIGGVVAVAWKLMQPVVDVMIAVLTGSLGGAIMWLWESVVQPVWTWIADAISWAWDNVIRPVWDHMGDALVVLGGWFSDTWNNVIEPVWDALGTGISWVWENVISPAWDAMVDGLNWISESFETAVGFIDRVWDQIKSIAAAPVLFVVKTVYQEGIKAVWDMVAGALNLPGLPDASGAISALENFHTGGIYPGYTPGRDVGLIGVSGGEAIMRPEWTRAVGEDYIHAANAAARLGGVGGVAQFLGGYASGGLVPGPVGAMPDGTATFGVPYFGGFPFGGIVDAVGGAVSSAWDATGGRVVSAVADAAKTGYRFMVNTAFDAIIKPIGDAIPDFGGSEIGKWPGAAFRTMTEDVRRFLLSIADDEDAKRVGDASPDGAERWIPAIKEALAAEGFPVDDAHIRASMAQIMTESTGNQYADQEVQDVNTGWNEAQGLVQVTPQTARGMGLAELGGDIYDPVTNLRLGMRWIKAGHGGDLLGTWGHGHGYASGGAVWGPGSGTSDSILARLSNGEFVINAAATRENRELLEAINAGWSPPAALLHELLPGYAYGGFVTPDQLIDFAMGVEGKPYDWGGVNWGDCSGAVSAIARYAVGMDPFGGRFATGNQGSALRELGFVKGLGPAGSLNIGWMNGGPWGGHTSATLPNGVNFEMGGARGDGQYGGQAAPATDPMYTDHMHLPPEFFLGGDPDYVRMSDSPGVDGVTPIASAPGGGTTVTPGGTGGGAVSSGGGAGAAASQMSRSVGGGDQPSIIARAINHQTGIMGELADGLDASADDRQIDAEQAMRDMVQHTVADAIAVPLYDATVDALGSVEARRLAITIGEQVADTIADGIASAESAIISGITGIVNDVVGSVATGLIDAAFGKTDEDAYGGPLFQAIANVVGAQIEVRDTLFAVADELRGFRGDTDTTFDHAGRIVSDTTALMQRTESSREQVAADQAEAAKEMVRATMQTAVTKILLPALAAIIAAVITAAFAAIGTAIAGPLGTGVGGAVGAGLSGAVMGAVGGLFDEGGLARGVGIMAKGTIEPERVLSPRTTASFERLVDILDGRGGGIRSTSVHAPITVTGGGPSTATDVSDRLLALLD